MAEVVVESLEIGGRKLFLETGRFAKQANGSIFAKYGDTVILVTACMSDSPREGIDFFPLLVDYEEKFYAAGKIPGGFIKREGKPSEQAVLSARLIDRSIRSLFPEELRNDVQVVATVLCVDQQNPPNILAINAASAALMVSDIPWNGPVGAVRVGYINGKLIVNPTEEQMEESLLDLVVAGHEDGICMVEAGANEVSEDLMIEALEFAHNEIKKLVALQKRLREKAGKEKIEIPPSFSDDELAEKIKQEYYEAIYKAIQTPSKEGRNEAVDAIRDEVIEKYAVSDEGDQIKNFIKEVIDKLAKEAMRELITKEGKRVDGRGLKDIRPITCEIGVLPRTHGSAVFTRGETQAFVVTTLGMVGEDEQIVDGLKLEEPPKRFMLHYNFPPYSVGEVRPMRAPGRREIGHGALAERALKCVIPSEEEFPYIIRVVSEILESNGSSSMATVCGGSLSLMDAGVPIKKAVAGVAMGLIKDKDNYLILTDILGMEDHFGDMDFKVAGTIDGITALQLDNKIGGIPKSVLKEALMQAKEARLYILSVMQQAISKPREDISPYAPRIYTTQVNPERIRDLIGPGGKTIRNIIQKTGVKIEIEDDGKIFVASTDEEAAKEALKMIEEVTKDFLPGDIVIGKVKRVASFGVFLEIASGKEALLHISEVSPYRVTSLEEIFQPGEEVLVMIREVDDMGRINLTRKRILELDKEALVGFESAYERELEREKLIASLSQPPKPQRPKRIDNKRIDNNRKRR